MATFSQWQHLKCKMWKCENVEMLPIPMAHTVKSPFIGIDIGNGNIFTMATFFSIQAFSSLLSH
jgi:hypothetical protein